ncbi:MAG TPA: hypothetical protein VGB97_04550 [Candidatus Paceibacterota bacterium]|jgi:hypothetical protein
MRLAWLFLALVLAALLAGVHTYALTNFWYWYFPWLDVPVHFLGGAFMGAAVVGVLGTYRPKIFLLTVAAGAIGWELFELAINIGRESNFILDTSLDLLMDALGITATYLAARLTLWR